MNATLTFSLPEENFEHQTAIDAMKWRGIVSDLDEKLRTELKYGTLLNAKTEGHKLLEDIRSTLHQWMAEENLSLH
jgi:hypothetical protein